MHLLIDIDMNCYYQPNQSITCELKNIYLVENKANMDHAYTVRIAYGNT